MDFLIKSGESEDEVKKVWSESLAKGKRVNRTNLDEAIRSVAPTKLEQVQKRRKTAAGRAENSGVFVKLPADMVKEIEIQLGSNGTSDKVKAFVFETLRSPGPSAVAL